MIELLLTRSRRVFTFLLLVGLLGCFPASPLFSDYEHPYIRFERGFYSLLRGESWHRFTEKERIRLTRLIWRGSGKDYLIASTMAAQGICESHYVLPGKYDNYRGFFGMHNRTLIAEVRRRGRDGSKSMWLAYSKRDPISVSYWSASRLAYLNHVYLSMDVAIKCWVAGEGWMKSSNTFNRKDLRKANKYLREVRLIRCRYFEDWDAGQVGVTE